MVQLANQATTAVLAGTSASRFTSKVSAYHPLPNFMEETPAEGIAIAVAHAAYKRLHQQAAAPGLSPADLRALLAESLTQQQALLRHTEQLHAAEAVAGLGSYELEVATGTLHFSAGLFRLLGETPDAFQPSVAWLDARSNPEDAVLVRQVLAQALAERQPYQYTRRIRRADGQWRSLESHGRVMCDAAGQALRVEGVVTDQTDQLHTQQTLRRAVPPVCDGQRRRGL
jgi:PAS domain-containing protein